MSSGGETVKNIWGLPKETNMARILVLEVDAASLEWGILLETEEIRLINWLPSKLELILFNSPFVFSLLLVFSPEFNSSSSLSWEIIFKLL